jgi:UDP-N-acetylmuramyl-tripeptide synthetase
MLDNTLYTIKKFIPKSIFNFFNPAYHWILAFTSAIYYGFPSKKIKVIAVTGTKGKSSTTEIINAILEHAGYRTALSNTIRFKIDHNSEANLFKMSTPGRFFLQRFIRKAVNAKCQYLILEISSQAVLTYRHRFVELDTFIFTNLSKEHIEAHGSYDNYRKAKLEIAKNLERSSKSPKTIIVNGDDIEADNFLKIKADLKISYNISSLNPYSFQNGIDFTYKGIGVHSNLNGEFNLSNILASITCSQVEKIDDNTIIEGIEKIKEIPGRLQTLEKDGVKYIIDYAHTTDSLKKVYEIYKNFNIIAVLGGTGGGRDTQKRSEMGQIADQYCKHIIITNEDPYDENPEQIMNDVASKITFHQPKLILDRKTAIKTAIDLAQNGEIVIISGKGTDPYIMGPNNTRVPWSDYHLTKELLGI